MSTTHVILPDDDPEMTLTLDLFLALIYGWLVQRNTNVRTLRFSFQPFRDVRMVEIFITHWRMAECE